LLLNASHSAAERLIGINRGGKQTADLSMGWTDPYVIGAVLLGAALRLVRLDYAPLWFDETITAEHVSGTLGEMMRALFDGRENSLPAYLLLIKAWTAVVGASVWTLRVPSVLLSCVAILLTSAFARSLAGVRAARWTAALVAISPYFIHHAQEARMYAMVAALAAASLLLLSRYLYDGRQHLGVTFVLVNLALLATHYYAVFLVASQVMVLMLLRRHALRSWLPAASALCIGVLIILLAALLVAARDAGADYNLGPLAFPGLVWSMLAGYALLPSSAELHAGGVKTALSFLPVAVLGASALVVVGLAGLRAMSRDARILSVTILLMCTVAPFIAAAMMNIGVNPRYAMPAAPVLVTLIACGAPRFPAQWLRSAATFTLVATMAFATGLHLRDPGHGREDISAAGQWLDANVVPSEEIMVTSSEMAHLARFHWPQRRFTVFPPHGTLATQENADALAATVELPPASSRLIYLFGREWLSDPQGLLRQALLKRYEQCPSVELRGISILCLTGSALGAESRSQ
jgi:4-amino-4-deoxy-L-arabinose transferase-like glycosyltransferase